MFMMMIPAEHVFANPNEETEDEDDEEDGEDDGGAEGGDGDDDDDDEEDDDEDEDEEEEQGSTPEKIADLVSRAIMDGMDSSASASPVGNKIYLHCEDGSRYTITIKRRTR